MTRNSGWDLYKKARTLIPGGTQLLSKRPEMFLPEQWPCYYETASGAEIIDLDGRRLLDMSYCGIGSTVLGYADPDVNAAVKAAIDKGSMTTLNCREEVELAERLVDLHPWADMARFSRAGGEAMAMAVRIARAATGRDHIAFCGYHGWHDWYLSSNLNDDQNLDEHLLPGLKPVGVPRNLKGLMHPFRFNQLNELDDIISAHGNTLAAIIMEPMRDTPPTPEFLKTIRAHASRLGAVLIFDEITVGFRMNPGGLHLTLGVDPDIAVFAKALGNGYPISAVIGRADVMQAAQSSFISSTSWTDRTGPAAALATLLKFIETDTPSHLIEAGRAVRAGLKRIADECGLSLHFSGIEPLTHIGFETNSPITTRTLYTKLMLERGVLATGSFYAMLAHGKTEIDRFLNAANEALPLLAEHIKNGTEATAIGGPVAHDGFRRLT